MTPEIQTLLDVIQQVGMWAVFAWLFINEKRDHAETRKNKDLEIERLRAAHLADIRDIAGLQRSLYQVGSPMHPAVPRDSGERTLYSSGQLQQPGGSEMRPIQHPAATGD